MTAHTYDVVFLALLLPGVSAFVPGQTVQNPGATQASSRFRLPDTQVVTEAGRNDLYDATLPADAAVPPLPGQPQIAKAQMEKSGSLFSQETNLGRPNLGQPMPAQARVPMPAHAQATATAAKPKGNGSFFGPGMMYGGASLACLLIISGGVVVARKKAHARTIMSAQASPEGEDLASRRDFMSKAAAGLAAGAAAPAFADVDYDGIKYLGGGDKIDLNNANIRAYIKLSGMYPGAAGKIASWRGDPFKSVGDVYKIPGLSDAEKAVIKKYESQFVVLDPKPEYVIDRMNNGLYR